MLKGASVLLLDKAIIALDTEVEAAIQCSPNTLIGGTVVAMAATDRIIVFDQRKSSKKANTARCC